MIGGPALQRQRLKEYLPADLCHHGRTAAVEVLWVVWRPLNEPWGLRFVWVSEIEHLGIPFFMPFFLDLEFFYLFLGEDACICVLSKEDYKILAHMRRRTLCLWVSMSLHFVQLTLPGVRRIPQCVARDQWTASGQDPIIRTNRVLNAWDV